MPQHFPQTSATNTAGTGSLVQPPRKTRVPVIRMSSVTPLGPGLSSSGRCRERPAARKAAPSTQNWTDSRHRHRHAPAAGGRPSFRVRPNTGQQGLPGAGTEHVWALRSQERERVAESAFRFSASVLGRRGLRRPLLTPGRGQASGRPEETQTREPGQPPGTVRGRRAVTGLTSGFWKNLGGAPFQPSPKTCPSNCFRRSQAPMTRITR